MLSYKANKYITLKLEDRHTQIYVNNRRFSQCIRLVLNIPTNTFKDYQQINSIDEAADVYKRKTIHQNRIINERGGTDFNLEHNITPQQEFWGHCSNIQTWIEHKYDTRLLHSNLSFPLLKRLYDEGDPIARKVFKDEIALRLESGSPNVIEHLRAQRFLDYLTPDELQTVMESPNFVENLMKNVYNFRLFEFIDNLLFKLAPHYYKEKFSEDLHDISPRTTNIFAELVYTLIKNGKLEHMKDTIINSSSIGIGINFFEKKKEYSKIIDICKKILQIVPQLSAIWISLGYSLNLIGKFREGIDAYEHALMYSKQTEKIYVTGNEQRQVPESVVAWNNIGWTYNCLGEFSNAIGACNNAIKLDSSFANPYNHLGFAYYKKGQKEKGIELIEKAIEINPLYTRALSNLGRVHYEIKNYEESFNVCYRCLKIDKHFKEGLMLLRDLLTNRELIDRSITDYTIDQKISNPFRKLLRFLRKKHLPSKQ